MTNYEKFILTVCALAFPFMIYFSYKFYRYVNWEYDYKDQVIKQIKIEVKEGCLK